MAQTVNRLTPQRVKAAKPKAMKNKDGMPMLNPDGTSKLTTNKLADGAGLWLHVSERQKSWVYLFQQAGKTRSMGLGSADDGGVSLAIARELAATARQNVAAGLDPREVRDADKPKRTAPTFAEIAADFIEVRKSAWKDARAVEDWRRTLSLDRDRKGKLKGFCQELLAVPVNEITTEHIRRTLLPIWRPCGGKKDGAGIVTAKSLRDRLELILDYAQARGLRPENESNPASWKRIQHLMPVVKHVKKHHAALHWSAVPGYMAELRANPTLRSLALQFTLLTTVRTAVTIGARWSEIDADSRTWVVPGIRMKASRDFRIPLSAPALAILRGLEVLRPEDGSDSYVFPGVKAGKPMALNVMRKLMREDLAQGESTVHGTSRSSFRDWAADHGHDRDLAELSLDHVVGDATETAYRRSDVLERRRSLMQGWADHCLGPAPKPVEAAPQAAPAPQRLPTIKAFPSGTVPANAA